MGLVLAIAILTSFYLTPIAMRLAWRYDAVSRPDGFRKKHCRPTPEWGGLAVNASILVGIGISFLLVPVQPTDTPFLIALGASVIILGLVGSYDDLFDMRARTKLAGQVLAVLPLIAVGSYIERLTLFGFSVELGWLGIPWTVAWMVLGINALNLIDGMDGLASTMGITAAATVAVIAGITGNTHVAMVAVVLVGALAGFLAHNLPPARIYLGDCGSMVTGLILAALAIRVIPQAGTANVTMMCALLFVPLYDTVLAILRRGLNGNGIMVADRGHIHHRLLDRGFGVWGSLALLAVLSLTAGAAGCLCVLSSGEEIIAGTVLVAMALAGMQFELFGHREWAMLKARVAGSAWKGKERKYAALQDKQVPLDLPVRRSQEMGTRRKQLEGLAKGQSSLPRGINVRPAATENAGTAAAGKKYVKVLG